MGQPLLALALAATVFSGASRAGPVVLLGIDLGEGGGSHYDVPAEVLGRQQWLGLYVDRETGQPASRLEHVQLDWERLPDEHPHTIHRARLVPNRGSPEFLMWRVDGLTAGPAITAGSFSLSSRARQIEFRLGERSYAVRLDSAHQMDCDAVVTMSFAGQAQKLFDMNTTDAGDHACDDPHFEIHWAGDLDLDGRLDLVVGFSRKYSYHPRQLLLSSAARGTQLVAEAAAYRRYAD